MVQLIGVEGCRPTWLGATGYDWQYLDGVLATYSARDGDLPAWLDEQVASAQVQGLAIYLGLNVKRGNDGDALNADQLRKWGTLMLNRPEASGLLLWEWERDHFTRPNVAQALAGLSALAAQRSVCPEQAQLAFSLTPTRANASSLGGLSSDQLFCPVPSDVTASQTPSSLGLRMVSQPRRTV